MQPPGGQIGNRLVQEIARPLQKRLIDGYGTERANCWLIPLQWRSDETADYPLRRRRLWDNLQREYERKQHSGVHKRPPTYLPLIMKNH